MLRFCLGSVNEVWLHAYDFNVLGEEERVEHQTLAIKFYEKAYKLLMKNFYACNISASEKRFKRLKTRYVKVLELHAVPSMYIDKVRRNLEVKLYKLLLWIVPLPFLVLKLFIFCSAKFTKCNISFLDFRPNTNLKPVIFGPIVCFSKLLLFCEQNMVSHNQL